MGSDTNCSCGLDFVSEFYDNSEWANNKKSPLKFIEFLLEATLVEDIEYYCCWTGDCASEVENKQKIDIKNISLEKNYFGLIEKDLLHLCIRLSNEISTGHNSANSRPGV
ncbi:MAG: hypothetical protein M3512_00665 [Bacteroidota bacterium]|nr:hypothetical protein [Bacteroidota bacterium]